MDENDEAGKNGLFTENDICQNIHTITLKGSFKVLFKKIHNVESKANKAKTKHVIKNKKINKNHTRQIFT